MIPKVGFTVQGITENFFKINGAVSVSNAANSGIITATFPKTEDKPEDLFKSYIIIFRDVKKKDFYYDDIKFAYMEQLMYGTSYNPYLFSPDMKLTRAMAVTVLYRMAGKPDKDGMTNPFYDVPDNKDYTDAIKWAAANGIIRGFGNDEFRPDENITRKDLKTVYKQYVDSGVWPDDAADPKSDLTRAEFAGILRRITQDSSVAVRF